MTERNKSHGKLVLTQSAKPRPLIGERPALHGVWTARVLTLYPEMFPGVLGQSLTGKALQDRLWALETIDMRQFATDRHRTVDDTPAGGGPGMVLKPDIVAAAIDFAAEGTAGTDWPVIYLSPRGRRFDQKMARRLSQLPGVTLLCGRVEGVDQRVLDARNVVEVSLGDFVLSGGEIAAQALIDATVRLIPRVLGNAESAVDESFARGLLEHPHYTRPSVWEGRAIPEVLLSGHHRHIAEWRLAQAERLTQERRPDLWRAYLERDRDPVGDQELSDAQTIAAKGEQEDD
ncbi:MAG: tRNA (guanosine(37)-N1)-methyltransferase TrmD [Paracoccaceae bacterium]